jgi:hypothetical protein
MFHPDASRRLHVLRRRISLWVAVSAATWCTVCAVSSSTARTTAVAGQQYWQRRGGTPVITPGGGWNQPNATWDSHEIGTMSVVHDGDTYHMFFEACAYNGGHPLRALRIGHATSRDGMAWTKDPEPVLRNGTADEWDDEAVWDPFVLYDADAKLFKMWYGGQATGFVDIQWGYATSRDGRRWTKFHGPISHFDHTQRQKRMNDDKVVYDPVTQRWYLYFTFWPSGWGGADQHLVRVSGTNETNFNFSQWENVSVSGLNASLNPGHMSFSQVQIEDGLWHMFCASEDLRYSTQEHTAHAVSTDGGLSFHAVNRTVIPGQDACVVPMVATRRANSVGAASYIMLYDQPGKFDQRDCQPYLALLNGTLKSTIPSEEKARLGLL